MDAKKRALGWIRLAEREDYDAIILVIDKMVTRKGNSNSTEPRKISELPRALGVAIKTFDVMLADEQALSEVLETHIDPLPNV